MSEWVASVFDGKYSCCPDFLINYRSIEKIKTHRLEGRGIEVWGENYFL
jgi:hypothetical protein